MKVRAKWNSNRARSGGALLRSLEWFFLLFGLIALDVYIWINTSPILYQAYEDWAFDQQLRVLTPSPGRFMGDEIRWVLGRDWPMAEIPEQAALPPGSEPSTRPMPLYTTPLASSAVIGRLEIPNLHLTAMVREGADAGTLRRAVGHIPGTALPGRTGNVGLAGHRDTFFRALRNIQENDAIELQTEHGTYRYVVKTHQNRRAARCSSSGVLGCREPDASDLLSVLLRWSRAEAIHRSRSTGVGRSVLTTSARLLMRVENSPNSVGQLSTSARAYKKSQDISGGT